MDKNCTNCHHFCFGKGTCMNTRNLEDTINEDTVTEQIGKMINSGKFSSALSDCYLDIADFDMWRIKKSLKDMLDNKIIDKEQYKSLMNEIREDISDGIFATDSDVDSSIICTIEENLNFDGDYFIYINEPKEFCCSNYL